MSWFLERLNLMVSVIAKKTMWLIKPNQSLFLLVLNSSLGELKRSVKKSF